MAEASSSDDSASRYISVSDIRCSNLPGRPARYYVTLAVSGVERKTAMSKDTQNPTWHEQFFLVVPRQSSIALTVWRYHRTRHNEPIGSVDIGIDHRLDGNVNRNTPLELTLRRTSNVGMQPMPSASVQCKITELNQEQIHSQTVSRAKDDSRKLSKAPAWVRRVWGLKDDVDDTASAVQADVVAWEPISENIRVFASLVKDISEIYMYANAAMTVLSVVPTMINNQLKTDDQLQKLVLTLKRAYEFVGKVSPLEHIKLHVKFFEKMAHATLECGYFIKEYVDSGSFVARVIKGIASDAATKEQIENHMQTLLSLMDEFKEDGAIHTEITVGRALQTAESIQGAVDKLKISVVRTLETTALIATAVDQLTVKSYLDEMRYADGAGCVAEKRCLKGTRVRLLDSITTRLHGIPNGGHGSERILLLTGVAGSGKSAIAHEIAHRFKSLQRLGASFCFSASRQAEQTVDSLLSTISRDLADLDEGWRAALVDVIKSEKKLRTTKSSKEQFDNFIANPAQKLTFIGPIVIVIDAIDEVAEKDRDSLVDCLSRLAKAENIPANIRFLITSRPEPRMVSELKQLADVDVQDISNGTVETRNDIRLFVDHELTSKFPEPKRAQVREHWAPFLVERAENLFQWAATACAFITLRSVGSTPEKRFQYLQEGGHYILYSLYGTILDELVENITRNDPSITKVDILAKVRRVLALILTAREPLGWMAWMALLSGDTLQEFLEVVPFLGSLLLGTSAYSLEPVKPLHTSFRDYTTLPDGTYTVDIAAAEMTLSTLSFLVMEDNLKFNICDLETSYLANKDVPDLSGRIQRNISPALAYACRFWTDHLVATQHRQFPLDTLFLFLVKRLFYWIEVTSLLGMVDSASLGIKEIRKWIQKLPSEADEQLHVLDKMLDNVDQFLSIVGAGISFSTPHLYLSAPAYVPQASFIHSHFSHVYNRGIHVINRADMHWSECTLTIDTHNWINSVAISPDSCILAAAHSRGTVALWDAVTGVHVGNTLEGHTSDVVLVAFSSNAKTIVSGSDDATILLSNVATGTQRGGALEGYTERILSAAFSPRRKTMLTGSDDGTVRVWDVPSRELVGEPLTSHTGSVGSVAFSLDGRIFASGSADNTIRVWDAETRELMYAPLEGAGGLVDKNVQVWVAETRESDYAPLEDYTSEVMALAFSPDGRTLASGTSNGTIRLWDVATGDLKNELLEGHTSAVISIALSPDGRILASGSSDHTIRIWAADTGRPLGNPLIGHSDIITSLSFFPDNQNLVSVSADCTIRVWLLRPSNNDAVKGIAFSPGNEIAASVSRNGTVRLWDVRTGLHAGTPLRGHTTPMTSVVFSSDGRLIASGSFDDTIQLWNTQTGQRVGLSLVGHSGLVTSVAFSSDSSIIASGSYDDTIRLWSVATGEQLGEPLTGHCGMVTSVTFSPDGRYLASGSSDGTIILWDVTTRKRIGGPLRHGANVNSVTFSPDGQIIASGGADSTVRLWRADTRELIGAPLEAHTDHVLSVAFSPDSKTLVTGSADCTIRLWDIETHSPIGGPLRGHTDFINCVAFSPDGATILSGSDDRTVRLWRLPAVDPMFPDYLLPHELSLPFTSRQGRGSVFDNAHDDSTQSSIRISAISATSNNEFSTGISATMRDILNTDSSILDDESGYMLGPEGELLFWVPPDYRTGVCRTSTQWVAGPRSLRLDLSRFAHGERWRERREH
ncbi:WD40 repeat-like protein [Trametopsis cervina]|nr:WD40 repeat-like protein [Trametopsis cervina]